MMSKISSRIPVYIIFLRENDLRYLREFVCVLRSTGSMSSSSINQFACSEASR
jgi:hypothetical protein